MRECSPSCPWPQGERIAYVSGMSKALACRVGRHSWETEMRRLDDVEAARPVQVCSRCGKTDAGERIASSHGSGSYGPLVARMVKEPWEGSRRPWSNLRNKGLAWVRPSDVAAQSRLRLSWWDAEALTWCSAERRLSSNLGKEPLWGAQQTMYFGITFALSTAQTYRPS